MINNNGGQQPALDRINRITPITSRVFDQSDPWLSRRSARSLGHLAGGSREGSVTAAQD